MYTYTTALRSYLYILHLYIYIQYIQKLKKLYFLQESNFFNKFFFIRNFLFYFLVALYINIYIQR